MTERSAHASQAAVVLDIGGDVGALVLYTGAEDDEAERCQVFLAESSAAAAARLLDG